MAVTTTRRQWLLNAVWVNPSSGPLRVIWKFGSVDDWKVWRQVSKNCRRVNDVLFLGDWIKWSINVLIPSSPTHHEVDHRKGPLQCVDSCSSCVDMNFFVKQTKEATITFKKLYKSAKRTIRMRRVHLESHEWYLRMARERNNGPQSSR
jgi:hypothetical protein